MKGGGSVTEFEEIYRAYFEDVFLYIRRLSNNEHIAEEITSETFYKAMRSIDWIAVYPADRSVRPYTQKIEIHYHFIGKIEEIL